MYYRKNFSCKRDSEYKKIPKKIQIFLLDPPLLNPLLFQNGCPTLKIPSPCTMDTSVHQSTRSDSCICHQRFTADHWRKSCCDLCFPAIFPFFFLPLPQPTRPFVDSRRHSGACPLPPNNLPAPPIAPLDTLPLYSS